MLLPTANRWRARAAWWLLGAMILAANAALVAAVVARSGVFAGPRQVPLFAAQPGGQFLAVAKKLQEFAAKDQPPGRMFLYAIESDGSVENLARISKIENALTFTFVRTPDYLKRRDLTGYSDVRAIALLDIDVAQVIVSKASGIKSVSELTEEQDGKPRYRVYVGLDQSGTRETADAILKAAMDANRYDRLFTQWAKASHKVNFNDAAQLLRDRELDAAIFSTGLGAASAIKDLFEERPTDFQWLPLDQATQKELAQNGYDPMNVPGYTPEINVQTVGAPVLVATNRKTESWIVRDFVALLERHRSDLTPLLTPHLSRAPDSVPGLVTDPEQIKKLVAGQMPVHDGLQLGKWEVIGSWWMQGLGCLAMLMGQLGLLLVIRPVRASSDVAAQLGASGADGGAEASLHPTVQVAHISGRWTFAGNAFVAVMGFLTALVSAVIHLLKP